MRDTQESSRRSFPVPQFPEELINQGVEVRRPLNSRAPENRGRVTTHRRTSRTMAEKIGWLQRMRDEHLSVRAVAREAGIEPVSIRHWRNQEADMARAAGSRRRLSGAGRAAKHPDMEMSVYRRFLSHRARGLAVPISLLQAWSRQFIRSHHPTVDWRASPSWTFCFRVRWGLTVHVKTKIGQRLTRDCKQTSENFWRFVRKQVIESGIDPWNMINADQTHVFLEMLYERTLNQHGSHSVQIRSVGYEKERLIVMLAVSATGRKLPPMVIFKRKTIPNIRAPPGLLICAHEHGWMDSGLVQDWVQHVLLPFVRPPPGVARSKTLLILDSYHGHLTDAVLGSLRWHRITPAIIPGGCTPLLQPLDVVINRAFKAGVRRYYNEWFENEGIETLTVAGNLRKPRPEVVLRWVATSWDDVSEERSKHVASATTPMTGVAWSEY
ncbi:hypothetical protein CLOP_g15673 [Closterium sp. NIES-67]|nr:hypothetical protein CLOP_g15673 [Closterium sp. NIES-67]